MQNPYELTSMKRNTGDDTTSIENQIMYIKADDAYEVFNNSAVTAILLPALYISILLLIISQYILPHVFKILSKQVKDIH